jgi:hypothetical protein
VRCPRCGNENSEENRFCGMCGAKLLATPAAVTSAPAGSSAPVAVASTSAQTAATRSSAPPSTAAPVITRPQSTTPPRASAPVSQDPPTISGPSFLGLSDPPSSRKRASLSTDPHSRSGNLDYLLEDEEEHRGGAGKFFLILLALALAVGFGYLRWKNQGLPWLHLSPSKPAATAQNSDTTDTSSPATAPSSDANAPAAASPAPSTTTPSQPTAQGAAQQPAPDSSSATAAPAAANPMPAPDAGNPSAAAAPATGDTTKASSDASNASPDSAAAAPADAAKEPAKESAPEAADTAPSPKPKKPAPAPKPHAGVSSTPSDPVSEAQRYIYGRGVTQDCERGMRLLKPAAAQANPKAMIEMGALYSAGLCTPHDLPTAYRWFAMALRKEPDNQAIQTDLQKLWSEMTQPERQLAIKLSQ